MPGRNRLIFGLCLTVLTASAGQADSWKVCELVNRFLPGDEVDVTGPLVLEPDGSGGTNFKMISDDCPDRHVLFKVSAKSRDGLAACEGQRTRAVGSLIEDTCIPFTSVCLHHIKLKAYGC